MRQPIFLLLAVSAIPCACSTVPRTRVHAAASLPRLADVNPSSFREEEPRSTPFSLSGGAARGVAWADSGKVHGANIGLLGVALRGTRFAAGWSPFFAAAQVSHEGTRGLGSFLWAAAHFGGGARWRFSVQSSYAVMVKLAEEKGCERDAGWLFGTGCSGSPSSASRAEVKARELGFLVTTERRLRGGDSLLLVLAAYRSFLDAGNQLDVDPSGNYARHASFWNPGLEAGYLIRAGERQQLSVSVLAGAQWVKAFAPGEERRELLPSGSVRVMF